MHKVRIIRENGSMTSGTFPKRDIKTGEHAIELLVSLISNDFLHVSSYFMRTRDRFRFSDDGREYLKEAGIGDIPLLLWVCINNNKFCYIDQEMSCYRANSIGSWNDRLKKNNESIINHEKRMVRMIDSFNIETDNKYAAYCDEFKQMHRFSSCLNRNSLIEIISSQFGRRQFLKLSLKAKVKLLIGFVVCRSKK